MISVIVRVGVSNSVEALHRGLSKQVQMLEDVARPVASMRSSRSRTFRHLESLDSHNWTVSRSLRCIQDHSAAPPASGVTPACFHLSVPLSRRRKCSVPEGSELLLSGMFGVQADAEGSQCCARAGRSVRPCLCGVHGRHLRAQPSAPACTDHQRVSLVSASRRCVGKCQPPAAGIRSVRPASSCTCTSLASCRRFIASFGLVGAFITATAACGYLGLTSNRRLLLDLWYSKLAVALLFIEVSLEAQKEVHIKGAMLSVIINCTSDVRHTCREASLRAMQAAALVATFVNVKLHEHLPHDSSAEAQRIWQFVRRRILICQWSVAAVFGVQVPP